MGRDYAKVSRDLQELEGELSRRAFFKKLINGLGAAIVLERFGGNLLGSEAQVTDGRPVPFAVYSALGNIVIPVDQDPGWATFEPGISDYGLNVFVAQVLLGGNTRAFDGLLSALAAMNEIPPLIDYGRTFLAMSVGEQSQYLADILGGVFENDGVQDLLLVPAALGLFSTKGVFFSNYPRHLAQPDVEFQVIPPSNVRTGWDIMGFRGPISQQEEGELRARFFDAEVLPGIDPTNPFI